MSATASTQPPAAIPLTLPPVPDAVANQLFSQAIAAPSPDAAVKGQSGNADADPTKAVKGAEKPQKTPIAPQAGTGSPQRASKAGAPSAPSKGGLGSRETSLTLH